MIRNRMLIKRSGTRRTGSLFFQSALNHMDAAHKNAGTFDNSTLTRLENNFLGLRDGLWYRVLD